ncbi:MAG TPA: hypothetical protein VFE13_16775 [Caulobacteraceae bacterium]|nr:hypothetical protein [Caulobacteraceae bacterium]
MVANTGAQALSQFLSTTPNSNQGSEVLDRLARALFEAGDAGLAFGAAAKSAGISTSDFLAVLTQAIGTGVAESFEANGEQHLRLTPAGRSLYA